MTPSEKPPMKQRFVYSFRRMSALFAVLLSVAAACLAQKGGKASPKQHQGKTILLPSQMLAGQQATLAVLDAQGRLAPDVAVEFSGGGRVATDSTGRAIFAAPAPGVLLAHFPGLKENAHAILLPAAEAGPHELRVTAYAHIASVTDRFEISGNGFDGDAAANRVSLGGKTALVVAASPLALTVIPAPDLDVGQSQFVVESGGHIAGPLPLEMVSLELTADKTRMAANESGVLTVRVRGSSERVTVEVRNLSPNLVALASGVAQQLTTSGGADNVAQVKLRSLRPGDFSISARLVSQR